MISFNYTRPAGTSGSDNFLIDDITLETGCTLATATITGRVTTPAGLSLRNAVVSLTNSQGISVTATTSSFGVFSFANVTAGQSYVMGISSNRYRFAVQNVAVNGNLNLLFVGLE